MQKGTDSNRECDDGYAPLEGYKWSEIGVWCLPNGRLAGWIEVCALMKSERPPVRQKCNLPHTLLTSNGKIYTSIICFRCWNCWRQLNRSWSRRFFGKIYALDPSLAAQAHKSVCSLHARSVRHRGLSDILAIIESKSHLRAAKVRFKPVPFIPVCQFQFNLWQFFYGQREKYELLETFWALLSPYSAFVYIFFML